MGVRVLNLRYFLLLYTLMDAQIFGITVLL